MRKLSLHIILVLLCFNAEAAEKNYAYKYALDNEYAFSKQDPSTFKNIILIPFDIQHRFGGANVT